MFDMAEWARAAGLWVVVVPLALLVAMASLLLSPEAADKTESLSKDDGANPHIPPMAGAEAGQDVASLAREYAERRRKPVMVVIPGGASSEPARGAVR